jgi:hypothetical protein
MVNRIFSNYQLACAKAIEYSRHISEDIFIYEHRYPGGVEFELSLKEGGMFAARIPMKTLFQTKEQALRYKEKFEKQTGRCIFVKPYMRKFKSYNFKEGYILCFGSAI